MRRNGNRIIKVNKSELMDQIKENKAEHIKSYDKAVKAYKKEALKQLKNQTSVIKNGGLKAKLDLITPIDSRENYDKILQMFEWEVEDKVSLEQGDFVEYVQDETDFAIKSKFANMSYVG